MQLTPSSSSFVVHLLHEKELTGLEAILVAFSQNNHTVLQTYKKTPFSFSLNFSFSRLETFPANPHFVLRAQHESQITLEITHQGPLSLQLSA